MEERSTREAAGSSVTLTPMSNSAAVTLKSEGSIASVDGASVRLVDCALAANASAANRVADLKSIAKKMSV